MKSILRKPTTDRKGNRVYPYLGICNKGSVILFTAKYTGTIIRVGNHLHELGEYSSDWAEREFEPLTTDHEVILSNQ